MDVRQYIHQGGSSESKNYANNKLKSQKLDNNDKHSDYGRDGDNLPATERDTNGGSIVGCGAL